MDDEVVVVEKKSVPRTRMTVAILNSLLKQIAAQHPDTFPHLQKHGKKGRTVLAWLAIPYRANLVCITSFLINKENKKKFASIL